MHLVLLLSRVLGLISSALCGIIYPEVKEAATFPNFKKWAWTAATVTSPRHSLTVPPIEKGIHIIYDSPFSVKSKNKTMKGVF